MAKKEAKSRTISKGKKLIVQIPCYNESKTLAQVISEIPRSIPGISEIEVLVVDDGSTDNTLEVAKKAGAHHILPHKYNMGLGRTFKDGLDKAVQLGADIIVNIDGDGQFDTKDISKIILPILDDKADMVTVSRFRNGSKTVDMPYIKKWGNRRFTKLVSRIAGKRFTDTQCGFRAYSREAALRVTLRGKFTYTQEVFLDLAEKGLRIVEMPSKVTYDKKRKSFISGNLIKYGFRSLGIIIRATRDSQPLTFFGSPAALVFFLGCIGALYSFIFWLITLTTSPVRTLFNVSVFFMIFGISLGILALLADMLKTIKLNQEEFLYRLRKAEN